jgi:hypothetical protein
LKLPLCREVNWVFWQSADNPSVRYLLTEAGNDNRRYNRPNGFSRPVTTAFDVPLKLANLPNPVKYRFRTPTAYRKLFRRLNVFELSLQILGNCDERHCFLLPLILRLSFEHVIWRISALEKVQKRSRHSFRDSSELRIRGKNSNSQGFNHRPIANFKTNFKLTQMWS